MQKNEAGARATDGDDMAGPSSPGTQNSKGWTIKVERGKETQRNQPWGGGSSECVCASVYV